MENKENNSNNNENRENDFFKNLKANVVNPKTALEHYNELINKSNE